MLTRWAGVFQRGVAADTVRNSLRILGPAFRALHTKPLKSAVNAPGSQRPAHSDGDYTGLKHKSKEYKSNWWTRRGSNPRPQRCERRALPAELRAHSIRALEI